ncbi:MAG: phosphodiester glycosidase family protein [Actinomycetota bacterium]|nr:phosphodiester glycosidase family protein [Actinomycetota bacterium]
MTDEMYERAFQPVPRAIMARRMAERRRRFRRRFLPLAAVSFVFLLIFVSVVGAAATPGNEDFKAKWADWLRAHHAAFVVTPIESWYYKHQAPAKGGQPKNLNNVVTAPVAKGPRGDHLPVPAPVALVTGNHLANEGQWVPTGPLVNGLAPMYEAQFRADDIFTSQITTAVWMDPTLLRFSLVPGAQEPGGKWTQSPFITAAQQPAAAAAFNGGFRTQDAHGGFYLDGQTVGALQPGASSLVFYTDGHVDVGTWDGEVRMGSNVRAVMQNLVPIVDNGQAAPAATYADAKIFGTTIGSNTVVARSGVGVTARGGLVYVAGPAMSARSLAESLQRAGAVRAMTLDINPEWVTFNFYLHDASDQVNGVKLYPQMQRPASRYLGPTHESRDFVLASTP